MVIDEELKWQSDIDNNYNYVNIYPIIYFCSVSSGAIWTCSDARKIIFQAYLLSHINYSSTVWTGANEIHLKKLNSLHRRAAKLILPDQFLSVFITFNRLSVV